MTLYDVKILSDKKLITEIIQANSVAEAILKHTKSDRTEIEILEFLDTSKMIHELSLDEIDYAFTCLGCQIELVRELH